MCEGLPAVIGSAGATVSRRCRRSALGDRCKPVRGSALRAAVGFSRRCKVCEDSRSSRRSAVGRILRPARVAGIRLCSAVGGAWSVCSAVGVRLRDVRGCRLRSRGGARVRGRTALDCEAVPALGCCGALWCLFSGRSARGWISASMRGCRRSCGLLRARDKSAGPTCAGPCCCGGGVCATCRASAGYTDTRSRTKESRALG